MSSNYELSLDNAYVGPLDLLFLLMKREEIPFEKISIAKIAEQYLEYIKDLENVDLSYAGEFLALASRLMALKVRELLPKSEQSNENLLDFEIEREALILQMEEYQKFKRVALGLQELEGKNFGTYGRGRMEKISKDSQLADANIWQLFKAFHKSLQMHSYSSVHTIEMDNVTIEDREQHINGYLAQRGRAMFEDLLGKDRLPIMATVTFMAMLELTKTESVVFRQSETKGPLWLYRKKQNDEYKEELAQEKIYYSPDPNVLDGLVDYLQGRSLAQEIEEKSSLDSVLKNAMQLVGNGIEINESDVQMMLEGVKHQTNLVES
ncbi:MAG: segregation/condensation protein A [Fibromonadaceae bacterium]|jgi:segregation and condensation protein A|nr:segregation/condensation protein A [Fibromonadaceae bacterium]